MVSAACGQRGVDAGLAVDRLDDRVADRLHEAVDQGGLEVGAGGGVDAAGRDEAVFLRPQEARFPVGAVLLLLDLGEGTGDALAHVVDVGFLALGVLLDQHLAGDFLLGEGGELRWRRDVGQRKLF